MNVNELSDLIESLVKDNDKLRGPTGSTGPSGPMGPKGDKGGMGDDGIWSDRYSTFDIDTIMELTPKERGILIELLGSVVCRQEVRSMLVHKGIIKEFLK